uniref:Uncharacterized protein n=1 Tax=Acidianus brierleyi TaxID=41673 RepID=A0A2U9IGU6_9CREN
MLEVQPKYLLLNALVKINQPKVLRKLRNEKVFHPLLNTSSDILICSLLNLGPIEVAIPKTIEAERFPNKSEIIVKSGERPNTAGIKPIAYFATAVFDENQSVKIERGFTDIRTCVLLIY